MNQICSVSLWFLPTPSYLDSVFQLTAIEFWKSTVTLTVITSSLPLWRASWFIMYFWHSDWIEIKIVGYVDAFPTVPNPVMEPYSTSHFHSVSFSSSGFTIKFYNIGITSAVEEVPPEYCLRMSMLLVQIQYVYLTCHFKLGISTSLRLLAWQEASEVKGNHTHL